MGKHVLQLAQNGQIDADSRGGGVAASGTAAARFGHAARRLLREHWVKDYVAEIGQHVQGLQQTVEVASGAEVGQPHELVGAAHIELRIDAQLLDEQRAISPDAILGVQSEVVQAVGLLLAVALFLGRELARRLVKVEMLANFRPRLRVGLAGGEGHLGRGG